ncbi:unnamed protein product [Acanthoscelides obtectus]|uniref:Uncharacterized protein n=1 Tax=Acanthoscelides obtectus TaxID=200917 RepID=A0A9P0L6J7_ACAOB|nr:unnamed protein product [Acanthoscelides obtectus]CAK1622253.1 hypothetical protein AOBTE_LOCUS1401 [Acanthoscelides obtectus]
MKVSTNKEESVDNALPTEETGEADDDVEMRTAVVEEVSRKSQQPITSRPGCNKKQKKNEDLTTETLMTVRDHFKTPKEQLDRFDLLGKTIAVKLRGLEKRQALIAEKKIGDILFEAEMGSLNTAPIYRYAASPSQSPNTTPCPTPSPTYGQGSCTALASQSPNVTPCPTPSPTYGQVQGQSQTTPLRHMTEQNPSEGLDIYLSLSPSFISGCTIHLTEVALPSLSVYRNHPRVLTVLSQHDRASWKPAVLRPRVRGSRTYFSGLLVQCQYLNISKNCLFKYKVKVSLQPSRHKAQQNRGEGQVYTSLSLRHKRLQDSADRGGTSVALHFQVLSLDTHNTLTALTRWSEPPHLHWDLGLGVPEPPLWIRARHD